MEGEEQKQQDQHSRNNHRNNGVVLDLCGIVNGYHWRTNEADIHTIACNILPGFIEQRDKLGIEACLAPSERRLD